MSHTSRWPLARQRVLSGREVCRILESRGFAQVRKRGSHSHIVMQRIHDGRTTTVPVPDHRELRTGTLMSIIRQSGLRRTDFE